MSGVMEPDAFGHCPHNFACSIAFFKKKWHLWLEAPICHFCVPSGRRTLELSQMLPWENYGMINSNLFFLWESIFELWPSNRFRAPDYCKPSAVSSFGLFHLQIPASCTQIAGQFGTLSDLISSSSVSSLIFFSLPSKTAQRSDKLLIEPLSFADTSKIWLETDWMRSCQHGSLKRLIWRLRRVIQSKSVTINIAFQSTYAELSLSFFRRCYSVKI